MPAEAMKGRLRQRILLAVAVVVLTTAAVLAWHNLRSGPDISISTDRFFKCAECGEVFKLTLKLGDTEPLQCPKCGKNAGWIAEECYWTKDGKAKLTPTRVIVNQRMSLEGKTYCPDCGHEVTGHNRRPPKELMDEAAAAGRKN